MRDETRRNLRVGLLSAAALIIVAVAVLMIGQRQQLFSRHVEYHTTLRTVEGLQAGAPVSMDGVNVGFVKDIHLPTDPENQRIRVTFSVIASYRERVRTDTLASVKTIGLLGDKYLALTGGSAGKEIVPVGGTVHGEDSPEYGRLIAGGEDLMDNLLAISSSLKVILQRVEAGEGLLGDLTRNPEHGQKLGDAFREVLTTTQRILAQVEQGHGLLGLMVTDDARAQSLASELEDTLRSLHQVALALSRDMDNPNSAYAALLRDPEGKRTLSETLSALHDASQALDAAANELATGQGTLPRLLSDKEYADDFLTDLEGLTANLRSVSEKLNDGQGTAGAFINDPQMYEDLENVVRGVKSSKVVSWFIRNRRKKGEKVATEEARAAAQQGHETSSPAPGR